MKSKNIKNIKYLKTLNTFKKFLVWSDGCAAQSRSKFAFLILSGYILASFLSSTRTTSIMEKGQWKEKLIW